MTTIIKIFSAIFGYDYQVVMQQPTISKQKVVTLGTLVFIPVFLWMFSGFFLSYFMVGSSLVASLFVGIIMGGIILIIDRSFVATPKTERGTMLKLIRIIFAVLSTVLGSLAIDMVLFSGDLEEYRLAKGTKEKEMFIKEYKSDHDSELERIFSEKESARSRHKDMVKIHLEELDGKGGTGLYGAGKVAAAKEREKEKALEELKRLEDLYHVTMDDLESRAEVHAQMMATKRSDALLSKLKDLHEFVLDDGFTIGFYVFLFLFVLMLEAFFILYKSSVSDSIYECLLQEEEVYGQQKLKAYRIQKSRATRDMGLLGEDYEKVIRLIRGRDG